MQSLVIEGESSSSDSEGDCNLEAKEPRQTSVYMYVMLSV